MDWKKAFKEMNALACLEKNHRKQGPFWKYGQENSIRWIADQLAKPGRRGVLVADEVGMGKTRIVMGAILSVLESGGTVAAVVPPGLLYQWKKEWDDFLTSLSSPANKDYSPIILRSYNSLLEKTNLDFPLSANMGKWLLISHQFGPPRLAINSHSWRYSLPIFVKAQQQYDQGRLRNSHWQYVKNTYDAYDCLEEPAEKCSNCGKCARCKLGVLKKAAQFLRKESRWRLFNDIPERALESEQAKENLKEWFSGDYGKAMLGELLGSIDLVVIDEAHKNRSEDSKLEVNLSQIIRRNPAARHIAMTATPMELNPEQWEDLFSRIGEGETFREKVQGIITEFDTAHREANKYPDMRNKVLGLAEKSARFKEALKPFVTRRIRIRQVEMLKLLNLKPEDCAKRAHPHRDHSRPVKIEFSGVEEKWKPSILALEAIGKAAKGCPTDSQELNHLLGRLKISDSRYAAGQSCDTTVDEDPDDYDKLDSVIAEYLDANDKGEAEPPTRHIMGKLRRIQYWRKILKRGDRDLAGHPRIQRVANSIDEAIWGKGGHLKREKILVFGTYKKPLHTLSDVLNHRAVLRFLDRKPQTDSVEPPVPAVDSCLKNIDRIWREYTRLEVNDAIRLRRIFSSKDQLVQALEKGAHSYRSIRNRLTEHINKDFAKTLPGDASISDSDKVAQLLRDRLVNELICRGDTSSHLQPAEIKNRALRIWVEYLESYFAKESEETENLTQISEWKKPVWFTGSEDQIKRLDQIVDNLSQEELANMVKRETDHISGRLGFFARTLDGDVKRETRHVLQAQFNSKDSFPQVLIAQSQVGREGLNLHKACRTVIQFHSEWNPGVIEQQIGRVDRIDSFWEEKAIEYSRVHEDSVASDEFPKIDIRSVVFDGTYDYFQYNVSKNRKETLNAHLFGELLNEEALEKMPFGGDWDVLRNSLKESSPEFAPPEMPLSGRDSGSHFKY